MENFTDVHNIDMDTEPVNRSIASATERWTEHCLRILIFLTIILITSIAVVIIVLAKNERFPKIDLPNNINNDLFTPPTLLAK